MSYLEFFSLVRQTSEVMSKLHEKLIASLLGAPPGFPFTLQLEVSFGEACGVGARMGDPKNLSVRER